MIMFYVCCQRASQCSREVARVERCERQHEDLTYGKEFYKRVLISMVDVATTGARFSARQYFAGILSAIARNLSLKTWGKVWLAMRARQSKLCAHQNNVRFSFTSPSR